jgi:hypothetical protein
MFGNAVLLQKYIQKEKILSGQNCLDAVSKAAAKNMVDPAMGSAVCEEKCGGCSDSLGTDDIPLTDITSTIPVGGN